VHISTHVYKRDHHISNKRHGTDFEQDITLIFFKINLLININYVGFIDPFLITVIQISIASEN